MAAAHAAGNDSMPMQPDQELPTHELQQLIIQPKVNMHFLQVSADLHDMHVDFWLYVSGCFAQAGQSWVLFVTCGRSR